MSLRILPVAAPLASLLFFCFVVSQVNVTANCTSPSFLWTFNSLGQSPCLVAGYMFATCFSGSYTLDPLPSGQTYRSPSQNDSNTCQCSTVGYSLISACVKCQGNNPLHWSPYVVECTSVLPPSQFPNPVPVGTHVPHWAILDVTENDWDTSGSYAAGDNPEYGPGAIFGPSGVSTSSASASSTSTGTPSIAPTPPKGNSSNAGAIAGGVVGGIATISIVITAILYLRWRRSQAASAGVDAPQPLQNDEAVAQSPSETPLTMKLYDPNDPTTFPGYQGGLRSRDISSGSQVRLSSHVGSGNTVADMQTSQPYARAYHGLSQPV